MYEMKGCRFLLIDTLCCIKKALISKSTLYVSVMAKVLRDDYDWFLKACATISAALINGKPAGEAVKSGCVPI